MMDTSETYIRMCEKAVEIQGSWQPQIGDWFYDKGGSFIGKNYASAEQISHVASMAGFCTEDFKREKAAWLPRQDQLQEMMDNSGRVAKPLFYLIEDIHNFYHDGNQSFESMEQLWLAFVMKEKYVKVWNGQEWIREV